MYNKSMSFLVYSSDPDFCKRIGILLERLGVSAPVVSGDVGKAVLGLDKTERRLIIFDSGCVDCTLCAQVYDAISAMKHTYCLSVCKESQPDDCTLPNIIFLRPICFIENFYKAFLNSVFNLFLNECQNS